MADTPYYPAQPPTGWTVRGPCLADLTLNGRLKRLALETEADANALAGLLNEAFAAGQRDAQRRMREAIGVNHG